MCFHLFSTHISEVLYNSQSLTRWSCNIPLTQQIHIWNQKLDFLKMSGKRLQESITDYNVWFWHIKLHISKDINNITTRLWQKIKLRRKMVEMQVMSTQIPWSLLLNHFLFDVFLFLLYFHLGIDNYFIMLIAIITQNSTVCSVQHAHLWSH